MLSTEEEMQQFSENFAIETHLIKTYMYIAQYRRSQTTKPHF